MNKKSKTISISAALVTILISIMAIIGWFTHNDFLRAVVPGSVTMKFNTALCLILCSVVLLLYHFPPKNKTWHSIPAILSVVIFLVGLLTLLEYVYEFDFAIDELFFKDEQSTTAIYYAGRMSPVSALNFVFIGIGLLLLNNEKAAIYQFFYLAGITFVSLVMLIGFNFISDISTFVRLGISVAIGFILLSVSIYFAQPVLQKKISFELKLVTGFTSVIILISLLSIFSSYFSARRIKTSQMIKHTNAVLNEAGQILSLTKDIESGSRGYVITGDSSFLEYFIIAKNNIFNSIKKLKQLTKDNSPQQARIESLSALVDKRISFSSQMVQARNERDLEEASYLVATRNENFVTIGIRKITGEIQQEESKLLAQRQSENNKSIVSFNRAFIVLLGGVFLLLAVILFAIRHNISVRKKAEIELTKLNNELEHKVLLRTEQIERSEKRYRYLFENNPLPMWIIDLKTFKFLDVNEMATLQYGYSREEFLSMTTLDIRNDEDKELFKQSDHLAQMNETIHSKGIWNHRKKDGTIIQVEIIAHKLIFEGMPARFVLSNDVTEKKKAEEKLIASEKQFRYTLDNMMEGAQIIGFDWRYKYVNDSMAKHGKYAKEQLLGCTVMEKYPGIEQSAIYPVYQKCFNERISIHLENEFTFPDKTRGWFEFSFLPVPEGIFILSIDITERKKAQAEIKALNEGLEAKVEERTLQLISVNQELEAFSYSVSHDLRAPLRAVSGYAKILEEDYKDVFDEEGSRLLEVIQNNGKKMGSLIDDLLAFSRLGRKPVNRSSIDMTQLAEGVFTEVNKTIGNRAKIKMDCLHPAMGDYTLINQVITNLISNAVKYSAATKKPSVEIRSEKTAGELIYSISDNGVGFDMNYAHKLFGVFQRLHSAEEFEGTGVGLAIVKRIVNKHNGRVWAEGQLGKGATFYFTLPDHEII
ncbi:MAG: CHASE3 domain-containing protein [Ginsengibacter sp.]